MLYFFGNFFPFLQSSASLSICLYLCTHKTFIHHCFAPARHLGGVGSDHCCSINPIVFNPFPHNQVFVCLLAHEEMGEFPMVFGLSTPQKLDQRNVFHQIFQFYFLQSSDCLVFPVLLPLQFTVFPTPAPISHCCCGVAPTSHHLPFFWSF